MVRNLDRLKLQVDNLPKKADGSIKKEDHDFDTRLGIAHAPVTKRELCVVTVTHKYIHWIQYDVKILIHLMLGHHHWHQGREVEAAIKVKMELVQARRTAAWWWKTWYRIQYAHQWRIRW